MAAGEKYASELGQYPVIKLSLKSAKQPDYDRVYNCLRNEMIDFIRSLFELPEVKQWYDGYLFGETEVYNPWSIINYYDNKEAFYHGMLLGFLPAMPDYAAPFLDKGYTKIIKYGICFCEKSCMVEIR